MPCNSPEAAQPATGEAIRIRYSAPMRGALVISPLVFLALSAFAAVFAVRNEMPALVAVVLLLFAALFLYLVVVSARGLKFLAVDLRVSPRGLEFNRKGGIEIVPWQDIGRVRWRPAMQFLTIHGRDGKLLLLVDYWITGFRAFDQVLRSWSNGEPPGSAA
jgi:uncharacterized membrane protein YjgN (DUF898 family)